jgi:hypothetical protein
MKINFIFLVIALLLVMLAGCVGGTEEDRALELVNSTVEGKVLNTLKPILPKTNACSALEFRTISGLLSTVASGEVIDMLPATEAEIANAISVAKDCNLRINRNKSIDGKVYTFEYTLEAEPLCSLEELLDTADLYNVVIEADLNAGLATVIQGKLTQEREDEVSNYIPAMPLLGNCAAPILISFGFLDRLTETTGMEDVTTPPVTETITETEQKIEEIMQSILQRVQAKGLTKVYTKELPDRRGGITLSSPEDTGLSASYSATIEFQERQPKETLDEFGLTFDQRIELGTDAAKDRDKDGLPDTYEINGTLGYITDPDNADSDSDGLSDLREYLWLCDPTDSDSSDDFINDGDAVIYRESYPYKESPADLGSLDIDQDGLPTATEKYDTLTNYKAYSTDGDRYGDGQEFFGISARNEQLPAYVTPDPLSPATPDITIELEPEFEVNLKEVVIAGDKNFSQGTHTFTSGEAASESLRGYVGASVSTEAEAGWPPWSSGFTTKVEAHAGVEFEVSGQWSQATTDQKVTSEEAYSIKEVDLSGSTLQTWIKIKNVGNDILTSELREITLNFYMGKDEQPFHTENLSYAATNILPGNSFTITIKDIPLTFSRFQRLLAGEGVRVEISHYSFGKDQIYLENARASGIEIDIDDYGIEKHYLYVTAPISMKGALDKAGIPYTLSQEGDNFTGFNGKAIKTSQKPYYWWTVYISSKFSRDITVLENATEMMLEPGDYVVISYEKDSDGDMLSDTYEGRIGTRPNLADTDSDGLSDGMSNASLGLVGESEYGTNPLLSDTDGDGIDDKKEVDQGSDPLDPNSPVSQVTEPVVEAPVRPQAQLYDGIGHTGTKKAINADDYPNLNTGKDASGATLLLNDRIESVKVPEGHALVLYENKNFGGKSIVITANTPNIGTEMANKASSAKLIDISTRKYAILFSRTDYRGYSRLYLSDEDGIDSLFNDSAKSVKMQRGTAVVLYKDIYYKNTSWPFTQGAADIGLAKGDVSSIKIRKFSELKAIVWVNSGYKGKGLLIESNISNLGEKGMGDNISSLKIFGNHTLTLYRYRDYRGTSKAYTEDYENLTKSPLNFNDMASSLTID